MNNKKENLIDAEPDSKSRDETNQDNYLPDVSLHEVGNEKPLVRSRKIYIIGGLIALSVALVLIWLYATRNSSSGKPVPAPRNVSFGETDTGNNAMNSGEQTITISPEQLECREFKNRYCRRRIKRRIKRDIGNGRCSAERL